MTNQNFSEHFCSGIEEWKPICFECKYPKEKRTKMLLKEIKYYQKKAVLNEKSVHKLTKIIKIILKERDFYKKGLKSTIRDIKWSKKNTISNKTLINKMNKVIQDANSGRDD